MHFVETQKSQYIDASEASIVFCTLFFVALYCFPISTDYFLISTKKIVHEFSSFYHIDKNRFELRKLKNNFLGTD